MDNKKGSFLISFMLTASLLVFGTGMCADAAEQEKKWSFTFNDCTVSEALAQIAKATNREILVEGASDTRVDRMFKDQGLEEIIRELLRNEDYALEIYAGEKEPGPIKIQLRGAKAEKRTTSSPPAPKERAGVQSPPMPPGLPPGPGR